MGLEVRSKVDQLTPALFPSHSSQTSQWIPSHPAAVRIHAEVRIQGALWGGWLERLDCGSEVLMLQKEFAQKLLAKPGRKRSDAGHVTTGCWMEDDGSLSIGRNM